MATAEYSWTNKRMACIATYAILEGDDLLNQFDAYYLPFDKAGEVKLTSLPYYPKYGGHPQDIHGRADNMARKFFKFIVLNYTDRKENPMDAVEHTLLKMRELFKSKTATFKDLAEVADVFFKFDNE